MEVTWSLDPLVAAITALMAAGLIYVAWKELSAIHASSKAEVLKQLDARFSKSPMTEARDEARRLFAEMDKRYEHEREAQRALSAIADFTAHLNELKKANDKKYFTLIDICAFFETVGYLAYKKYVLFKDIYELFGGSILVAGKFFETHIKDLQKGPPPDPKLYENFLWLLEEVRKQQQTTQPT